jgi:large subunit ribosomal protein L22
MLTGRAVTRYVKISTRKARLAADLIRGKTVGEAVPQLLFCNLRAGKILFKTLQSAVANITNQNELSSGDLYVVDARVDQAPPLKRSKPKNKGGRVPYKKYMSHFTVVVGAIDSTRS